MRSLTRNIAFTIGIVAFLLSSIDIQAATPAPPPGFTHTGGLFAQYFNNAASADCNYIDGESLVGFDNTISANYFSKKCVPGFWISDSNDEITLNSVKTKVGIGISDPNYTLDLSGSLRLNLPSGAGDSKVLTSDSNGVAAWISIPATCTPKISGNNNLCQGSNTLQSSTGASSYNVGIGDFVMTAGITGGRNVGVGYSALRYATSGAGNTAIGTDSMKTNSGGSYNVAIGNRAMELNTEGSSNVAIGSASLYNNLIGVSNVSVGRSAMDANTSGNYNTALGYQALYTGSVSSYNTALGYRALRSTKSGYNTAIGVDSLYYNTSGYGNSAIGYQSLLNTAGNYNTALGYFAGINTTNGNINTFIGYNAGKNLITGTGNIAIGQNTDFPNANASNQITIGDIIYGTGVDGSGNGQIGIGSRFPTNKLHVRNDVNSPVENWIVRLQNNNGDAQKPTAGLLFSVGGDTDQKAGIIFKRTAGWGRGNMHFVTDNTADASLPSIDTDSAMTIGANGNVLIGGSGTTNNKLEVLGQTIKVRNVSGYSAQMTFGTPFNQNGVIEYATGAMTFSTMNTIRMTVGSGGNVGIGTTSPGARLTVGANLGGTALSTSFKTNAGALGGSLNDELSIASLGFTSSNSSALGIRAIRTANSPDDWTTAGIILGMDVDNTVRASSSYLMLHPNGSIGVGKTNPSASYKLDVAGTGAFQSIDAGKSISFAQPNPFIQFNAGGPSISLPSANNLAISTSGVERMRVDNNGNIGIADSTPSYKLDVAGTGAFLGLRVTSGASAGKVLTSDTTGNATWQSLPSGMPTGVVGNTVYHNGTSWVASSNIYNNNGNVGIGTTTPGTKLHVNGGDISLALTAGQTPARLVGHDNATSFWYIGASNNSSFVVGDAHSWDRSVSMKYVPGTTGAAGGVLDIGQIQKNGATYTHGITRFFTNGTEKMRIVSSGNVGIGATSPVYKLDINGDVISNGWYRTRGDTGWYSESYGGGIRMTDTTWIRTFGDKSFYHNTGIFRTDGTLQVGPNGDRMIVNTAGNVGIGNAAPSQKLTVNGNVLASGFIYSSDKNLKKDITPLSDSLSKITSLNGYSFNWKKTGEKDIGVIAQEVEKVFPDLVHTDAETGMKSVEYGNLIAPVIEAIKSQQQIIDEQNTRIQSLEARLEALEAKMK